MKHPIIICSDSSQSVENICSKSYFTWQFSAGRRRLAAAMINPLKTRLDYSSIARKVFSVEPMPIGALPIYYVDPKFKNDC